MMDHSPALPRSALSSVMTVLLAGGRGSRLHELTARVCKPALQIFATPKGPLRMVDFTMANAVRSGLPRLIAATQYRPEELEAHLARRWAPLFPAGGLVVRNGTSVRGAGGYGGTGDAVAAIRDLIDDSGARELLVLSGDHIYQMDYSALIAAHRASGAAVTLAVQRVPLSEASAFGVVDIDGAGRITVFQEKPPHPVSDPRHPGTALASMGVYVFDWAWLRHQLPTQRSRLDFGQDILPDAVAVGAAAVHSLPALPGQTAPFWRDVGTLDSLRQTLLEFSSDCPCHVPVLPGAPFRLSGMLDPGGVCASHLVDSVILPGSRVSPGAHLVRTIVAPGTVVPADLVVGLDRAEDARWFRRTPEGTTLITNAMLAQRSGRALHHLRVPLLRAFDLKSIAS